ncbi:MAG: ribosome recycling factor [Limnochordales bacterium]|nr:ribosome recycling factor [Limnochordales bacterium]
MINTKDVVRNLEKEMESVTRDLRREFAAIRTGRANPAILERVMVEYYGTPTPLPQLATVSVQDSRVLVVQPWDRNAVKDIEKAILKSDLALTPTVDGAIIRIAIPPLTAERRNELTKLARKIAEEHRVAIRNLRRDANEQIKKAEKTEGLSENESRRLQEEVQKLTDRFIAQIDQLLAEKEKEILEV